MSSATAVDLLSDHHMHAQVVIVHGGDSFRMYEEYLQFLRDFPLTIEQLRPKWDWKRSLHERLGEGFDVLAPQMPNKSNARYAEWVLWFEKIIPLLEDGVMLVGHSLGGMFLTKYLAEYVFPRRIGALLLVAAPHNHSGEVGDFTLPDSLDGVARQVNKLFLFHSTNDDVVPFSELAEYQKQLPNASATTFTDRGHFNQTEFPEIIRCIVSNT